MKKIICVSIFLLVLLVLLVGVVQAQTSVDTDGDGFLDELDNCPNMYNPQQKDANGDGVGNACDAVIPVTAKPAHQTKLDCAILCPETFSGMHGTNCWACLLFRHG